MSLERELKRAALDAAKAQMQDRARKVQREVRCPQHNAAPTVTVRQDSRGELSYHVSACCDAGVRAAEAKL